MQEFKNPFRNKSQGGKVTREELKELERQFLEFEARVRLANTLERAYNKMHGIKPEGGV